MMTTKTKTPTAEQRVAELHRELEAVQASIDEAGEARRALDEERRRALSTRPQRVFADEETQASIAAAEATDDDAFAKEYEHLDAAITAGNRRRQELRRELEAALDQRRAERNVQASDEQTASLELLDAEVRGHADRVAELEQRERDARTAVETARIACDGDGFVSARLQSRALHLEATGARLSLVAAQERHASAAAGALVADIEAAGARHEAALDALRAAETARDTAAAERQRLSQERDEWRRRAQRFAAERDRLSTALQGLD